MLLLGIDYGAKKVGLAMGDYATKIAFPFKVIKNKGIKDLVETIKKIIEQENIEFVIIGKPRTLQGKENVSKNLQNLFDEIKKITAVDWEDERYTTKLAEILAKDIPARGVRIKDMDDKLAAMIILQSYLDRQ